MKRGFCKSCGAQMLWATTATGNAIPLDVVRSLRGNVEILPGGIAKVVGVKADGVERYVSHFATCPNASEHRASGKKSRRTTGGRAP